MKHGLGEEVLTLNGWSRVTSQLCRGETCNQGKMWSCTSLNLKKKKKES